MTYTWAAYLVVWAALFGYLLGLTSRQARLNAWAQALTERLVARGRGDR